MRGITIDAMQQRLHVHHLDEIEYREAWALQRRIQESLIAAKRARVENPPNHALLLVRHPHVYTLGKNGAHAHLLASEELLRQHGATFVEVDRGGDITYHGPGQIVAYPILDLDRVTYVDGKRGTDIHRYLRELELAVIETCGDYGLIAAPVEGRTGVWIGPDAHGPERKVCAMGIRCSRWVTMHGLAFNVNTDLTFFDLIVPCGIRDRHVTSLAAELGTEVDEGEVTRRLVDHLAARFHFDIEEHMGLDELAPLSDSEPGALAAPSAQPSP